MTTKHLPKLAVLGAGGLGQEMLKLLAKRQNANLVAIVDKNAYLYAENGLDLDYLNQNFKGDVSRINNSVKSPNSIMSLLSLYGSEIDCIFYALPNLPTEFIPDLTKQIIENTAFKGVIVDAIKRTSAVKLLMNLADDLKAKGILYLTGCGATPGLLTSAAALAAQSFVEIQSVKIIFGVGINNWLAYRATIREDIAHLSGFDITKVNAMTEAEIDLELDKRNGLLELVNMEHADDIMLELAGICSADKVSVGGIVDTRNAQKPISTQVQITGLTYQGKQSTHIFKLGDETTMAANVNGTVLGFLNAGLYLQQEYGASGFKTAAQIMPRFASVQMKRELEVLNQSENLLKA